MYSNKKWSDHFRADKKYNVEIEMISLMHSSIIKNRSF